jgi:hypothetical protein
MTQDDPLTLQHRLAELATLEAAVRTTLRSLHVTYPILTRREYDEHCELAAARVLASLCDELLASLDKLVPLGERHLRVAISEFVEHYHLERNHQGLDNRLITAATAPANENADPAAPIARRARLGDLLSYYYYRPAA